VKADGQSVTINYLVGSIVENNYESVVAWISKSKAVTHV